MNLYCENLEGSFSGKNASHAKAKKSGSAKIRAKFETLSPVLTVPVWPRFNRVEDSRYTVMNRDTFRKN